MSGPGQESRGRTWRIAEAAGAAVQGQDIVVKEPLAGPFCGHGCVGSRHGLREPSDGLGGHMKGIVLYGSWVIASMGIVIAAADAPLASHPADQDPRETLRFPGPNYDHVSPCAHDPMQGDPGSKSMPYQAYAGAELGQADREHLNEQITADILAIQARCGGPQLIPGVPIRRADGTIAAVFHTRPGSTDTPVSIAYLVRDGRLHRMSMWVAPEGDLEAVYENFRRMLSGESSER